MSTTGNGEVGEPLPTGDLFLRLDRSGRIPLYYQIAEIIEAAIADGTLPTGIRLENEVSLGERLGISRPTIRRAIQELVNKGLLVRRRGIGTQVVQRPVTRKFELSGLYDDLLRGSRNPTTDLLVREVVPADAETAKILSVPEGVDVLHLRRLRYADGVPLAVLENSLPIEFASIADDDLRTRGLYGVLQGRGTQISVAYQQVGARGATAEEGRLLGIPEGAAVLTMERTAYNNDGRAVEFGRHCYRPDLYSFEMTLVNS
ncbi:GntR family transcriptional regulator [Microbacterium capsulatum]|uniref:GntR family transcriptional regulator n=1 Tax=Microbacterium capsulatum TaxID=3041921 RepID=A0ABU0XGR8_9MICO|nr:GntR family transcriptional regulator [Microbacterium sp. ASV81]MDQ4214314.1 GntR family transcriptional regulator [Microbacterium sp. ASV81]